MEAVAISRHEPAVLPGTERWNITSVLALYELPFPELMYRAQTVHRDNHDISAVQLSSLLSIKTGGCPEDCSYCPQSARYETEVEREKLMPLDEVLEA
ncbi:MAG: biotin synthase, partial [Pusillimonas sp.]